MTISIVVALLVLAVAVAMQRLMLSRRSQRLRAREQAFRFHAIRDELQLLALKGIVKQNTEPYDFIMWTANLCIRNAGTMKLRDTLGAAQTIDSKTDASMKKFLKEVERQPEPLQRLIGKTFTALAETLVVNDHLVRAGLYVVIAASNAWELLQPMLRWFIATLDSVAQQVAPTHAEVVRYARKYHALGDRFAAAA